MKFIAFYSEDPQLESELASELRAAQEFEFVDRLPESGWVVAHAGTSPADRRDAAFFVEGGDRLAGVGSPELVRRAAAKSLQSLPGDFTFACFGPSAAHFVRSATGTAPLFVWRGRGVVGVASRMTDLTRHLPTEPALDRLALAILSLSGFLPPAGRTPLKDVTVLPAGTAIAWTRSRGFGEPAVWWSPPPMDPDSGARFAEHARELGALLVAGLERALDPDGQTLLTLSGGFDSSVLAWLAGNSVGRQFSALTMTPWGGPAHASVNQSLERLVAGVGSQIVRHWRYPMTPESRMEFLERAPKVVWGVGHPVLCLLPELQSQLPLRVYVGGEYCDELLGGGPAVMDWGYASSMTQACRAFPASMSRAEALSRWAKLRARRLVGRAPLRPSRPPPGFLSAELAEEWRENGRNEQRRFRLDGGERPYLAHRLRHTAAIQNWEVVSGLGIRRHFPFLNREVVEFAHRCSPTELTGRRPKRLVRAAVRPLVPRYVVEMAKETWWDAPVSHRWTDPIPSELAEMLREDWRDRMPRRIPHSEALRLKVLLNIILSIRNCRAERRKYLDAH